MSGGTLAAVEVVVDDGVRLAVERRGTGPPLVLVHGFGGAKEDFADHLDALARSHEVVTFDHRGHGASDNTGDPGSYSLKRMAADVLALADTFGFERFRLLGHSMGGMVAQHVVMEAPDRVEALVLMDTCGGSPAGIDPHAAATAAGIARDEGLPVLKRLLDQQNPLETPAKTRLLAERPGYREQEARNFLAQDPEMYAELVVEMTCRPDRSGDLSVVACPTLVVVGEQDAAMLAGCHSLAAAIPGARLEVISEAGHSPQFENPSAWRAALESFLSSLG